MSIIIALLALVGLVAIIFVIRVLVNEAKASPHSREELLVEVEVLRRLGELTNATWRAERRMLFEAMKRLRSR